MLLGRVLLGVSEDGGGKLVAFLILKDDAEATDPPMEEFLFNATEDPDCLFSDMRDVAVVNLPSEDKVNFFLKF